MFLVFLGTDRFLSGACTLNWQVPIYDLEDPKSLAKYLLDADVRLVRAPCPTPR